MEANQITNRKCILTDGSTEYYKYDKNTEFIVYCKDEKDA
jgi:hypothetical protein